MTTLFEPYETFIVSKSWLQQSKKFRLWEINNILNSEEIYKDIRVKDVNEDGQVVLVIEKNIPANERGLFLLSLEEKLKQRVDKGITIWLEPVGDKSKLRNLRGVQIKA